MESNLDWLSGQKGQLVNPAQQDVTQSGRQINN